MPLSDQRYALLVGVNRYGHLAGRHRLHGAVRDAEEMASVLTERFGFPPGHIQLLRDGAATRTAVLDAVAAMTARVVEGTVVVFHWSGHGSSVRSSRPGEWDETVVPYDARGGDVPDLRDKELLGHLAELGRRGARVTWLADTCHSGHLYRDPRHGTARWLPPTAGLYPSPHHAETPAPPAHRDAIDPRAAQVLLAACGRHEKAFERTAQQQQPHGYWTSALLEVLHTCPADATAHQVGLKAAHRLAALGVPQHPRVIGDADRPVFGVVGLPPKRYVEVRSVDADGVVLAGGENLGLMQGSRWQVFKPLTFSPEAREAKQEVELRHVGATTSRGHPVATHPAHTPPPQPGDWSFQTTPAYGRLRVAVRCLLPRPDRGVVEAAITQSPVLRLADTAEPDPVLWTLDGTRHRLLDSRGVPLPTPAPGRGARTVVERLLHRLECHARSRHGRSLENRDPASRVSACLRARLLRQDGGTGGPWEPWAPSGHAAEANLWPGYRVGEGIALEIHHEYPGELYVYVLDFGLTDQVDQLFPPRGGEEALVPGESLRPGTLPGENFEVYLPGDAESGEVGCLKVFATTEPTRFDWLLTSYPWPRAQRSGRSSLTRLLSMHQTGPAFRSSRQDWGSVLLPYRIIPHAPSQYSASRSGRKLK